MTPESIQNRGPMFALMFEDGAKHTFERAGAKGKCHYTFRTRKVCDLYLPTGRLVACDPGSVYEQMTPFTRAVPNGAHPVFVSLVGPRRSPTVASAKVVFDDTTDPAKWEMALLPKQNPQRLKRNEFFGFGVDGGMAAIGDQRTFELFRTGYERNEKWVDKFVYQDHLWSSLMRLVGDKQFRLNGSECWELEDNPQHNLAVVKSGWGDGSYPVFFGTTKRSRILTALIDFFVVNWEY